MNNVADHYEHTQNLHDKLFQNIGEIQHSYNIVRLLSDFNGRISQCKEPGCHSTNRKHIEGILHTMDLILLNTIQRAKARSPGAGQPTPSNQLHNVLK